jgi:heterodisulfide reductase subunit A
LAARPIHKDKNLCQPAALVIGGGVSGMTAALAIADSGYDVHLVERTEMLGGNLNNLYYVAEGYDPQRLLRDLVNRVRAHRRIAVHTRTEIMRHTGHVGISGGVGNAIPMARSMTSRSSTASRLCPQAARAREHPG